MNDRREFNKQAWRICAMCVATLLGLTACAVTTGMSNHSMRTAAEGDWYHPVEVESWVSNGADRETVERILTNILTANGDREFHHQPDTLINYGPGHWVYEFTAAANNAMNKADLTNDAIKRRHYLEQAVIYYHLASSPHTKQPRQREALKNGSDAYAQVAEMLPGEFERNWLPENGHKFEAFYHLPPHKEFTAVVVMSNGSDTSKELALSYYEKHLLPKNIAMVSIDIPGMGGSDAYLVQDGQTDRLHAATVKALLNDERFQNSPVFVQGASFGGHAAARFLLARDNFPVAGVISICAPLHIPFMAPAGSYKSLPRFTIDGVKARIGLHPDASYKELADAVRILSLENQNLTKGSPIETPLLIMTTNNDPVAPLEDLTLLQRAKNSKVVVFDEPGHCSDRFTREAIASAWMMEIVNSRSKTMDHMKILGISE